MSLESFTVPGVRMLRSPNAAGIGEVEFQGQRYLLQVIPLGDSPQTAAERVRRRVCQLARDVLPGLPQVRFLHCDAAQAGIVIDAPTGSSLAEYIRRGVLTDELALVATRDVMRTLTTLHSVGDVHGGVTLENIVAHDHGAWGLLHYGPGLRRVIDPARGSEREYHADYAALGDALEASLLRTVQPASGELSGTLRASKPELASLVDDLRRFGNAGSGLTPLDLVRRIDDLLPNASAWVGQAPERLTETLVRQSELAKMRRVFATNVQRGLTTIVLRGSAGSGKSHLVGAFIEGVQARVVRATCRNWEVAPFGAVRQLLEALVCVDGAISVARTNEIADIVGELKRFARPLSSLLTQAFPEGGAVPEAEGADDVYSEGVAELIAQVLDREPTLIVLEDVHWLDEASRKVLKRVFERLSSQTLLIVTARNDPDSERQAQRFLVAAEKTLLWDHTLSSLDPQQAAMVAAHYLGPLAIPEENANALALLSDCSPLSVVEVVRSVLDAGLLLPLWRRWALDVPAVTALHLPSRTTELIAQRLQALDGSRVDVLRVAAIIGLEFDVLTLCAAVSQPEARVIDVISSAHRLTLVEHSSRNRFRFIHQCVRDALTDGLPSAEVQRLHHGIVSALRQVAPGPLEKLPAEVVFQLAYHSSLQGTFGEVSLACSANIEAGKRAISAYDNGRALAFLEFADLIASETQRRSTQLRLDIAEARLRLGSLRSSREMFESELAHLEEPFERARVLSRLSIICEAFYDSAGATSNLERALVELDEPVPCLTLRRLHRAVWLLFRPVSIPRAATLGEAARSRAELVCSIYLQLIRLAILKAQIGRVLDATTRCMDAAMRLGESPAMARAFTMRGFVLTVFQRHDLARRVIAAGLQIARRSKDPPVIAHILTHQAGLAGWRGNIDLALELGSEAMSQYQSWMIPSELALVAINQELMETVRGRARRAWRWLESVIVRTEQYEGIPLLPEVFALRARTAAMRLGFDCELSDRLTRLDSACLSMPPNSAFYSWKYGPRARMLLEGSWDVDEFERLVSEVDAERFNPRRIHIALSEYYVVVAHARVNICLNALDKANLAALEAAAVALRAAARVRLLQAHARVIEAFVSLFHRRYERSATQFDAAERLAIEEKAPWVAFGVARGRAHLRRIQGHHGAALEQAQTALGIARENGVVAWERWITAEFEVGANSAAPSVEIVPREDRRSRQLRAFLNVSRASSIEVDPQKQAEFVLDEMIELLGAERGALYLNGALSARGGLSSTSLRLQLLAARQVGRLPDPDAHSRDSSRVESALRSAQTAIAEHSDSAGRKLRTTVLPLTILDQVVGAVSLEGSAFGAQLSDDDAEVLRALARQVPIALELAHVLRDRERLEEDLRQSQKMEAIGRLAGGIAHDFNNMLAAISVSSDVVLSDCEPDAPERADLETIRRAADRATRLTKQLLAFSRRQTFDARPLDLNQTIREVVPMLQRLLGSGIRIEEQLKSDLYAVKADVAQLEQVLVNLAVNARDAMPDGGCLRLETRNVTLTAGQKPVLDTGEYSLLIVRDDGVGMVESVQRRIFEPFFTTKTAESGTGLGMAMVYGIVRQSGGHIELDSEPGVGTEFRIYLPRTLEPVRTLPPPSSQRGKGSGASVLLVDDEPLVRHAFSRTLRRMGYDVTVATGGREAMRILTHNPKVDLIITDVIMPEMNGVELVEKLKAMGIRANVLYMSGYADGVLARRASLGGGVAFVQKPIENDELANTVEQMLGNRAQLTR